MKVVKFKNKRQRSRQTWRPPSFARALTIIATVIAVFSAAIWLVKDARNLNDNFRPSEGSLIVNINTATKQELISIPGIGSARAAQIMAGRPYAAVDELSRIAGIGSSSVESLRPFVTVDGETRRRE